VFVNLWGQPQGHPLTYPAIYDLVGRLRRRTGIAFGPHLFRHTYATWLVCVEAPGWKREGAAGPRLDHHHGRHLRAPDRGGRPADVGGGGMVYRPGGSAVTPPVGWPSAASAGLLEKLLAAVGLGHDCAEPGDQALVPVGLLNPAAGFGLDEPLVSALCAGRCRR